MESNEIKLTCFNRGCGKLFYANDNNEESCRYHAGEPFFHDAYKGWSCCGKKTTNFTEFLDIQGCTLSKHNPMKSATFTSPSPVNDGDPATLSITHVKPVSSDSNNRDTTTSTVHCVKPIAMQIPPDQPSERPPSNETMIKLEAHVFPDVLVKMDNLKNQLAASKARNDINEPLQINDSTLCKNNVCKIQYAEGKDSLNECCYHPGTPVFHEGLKYWSCCKKFCTDFSRFLEQAGCTIGEHVWLNKKETTVDCRYDWHQTAENAFIIVYAKEYDPKLSYIKANQIFLSVRLYFPATEQYFEKSFELYECINLEKSSVSMKSMKIEIKLRKNHSSFWKSLEYGQKK